MVSLWRFGVLVVYALCVFGVALFFFVRRVASFMLRRPGLFVPDSVARRRPSLIERISYVLSILGVVALAYAFREPYELVVERVSIPAPARSTSIRCGERCTGSSSRESARGSIGTTHP